MKSIGIDTGGTFTDFVIYDGKNLSIYKVASTPGAPEAAILQGLTEKGELNSAINIVHGSTVATNAVLEKKGVRTLYVTNRGLKDVLTIGRQTRDELYNLQPQEKQPPVEEMLCIETGGRLSAQGEVIEPLTEADLIQFKKDLMRLKPESVAINLLFPFLDDQFERLLEAQVPASIFVSRSSAILDEAREYERGIATWINAWIGPKVARYLQCLGEAIPQASLSVMQSNGGLVGIDKAGNHAVRMLLSGPAGGLMAAKYIGDQIGVKQLLTFDMGGTSSDVALIDGEIRLTTEGRIANYPVAVPMVAMHTIGAGGGSIADIDPGGLLQVGPESAGAEPGPACYAKGGKLATVTDANVVLGRILPNHFLGGTVQLDKGAAEKAITPIAQTLDCSIEEAALGIVRIANEHMVSALRVISVEKGKDPRDFSLFSFGGAGGLHVCALAEALGMSNAIIPVYSGVLSALGMLVAPFTRQLSKTMNQLLDAVVESDLNQALQTLANKGIEELQQETMDVGEISTCFSLDLRYLGQTYALTVPWSNCINTKNEFIQQHMQRYGHVMEVSIEIVNLRVLVQGRSPKITLPRCNQQPKLSKPIDHAYLYKVGDTVPVYRREQLGVNQILHGPALIVESIATTLIAPCWECVVDEIGNLLLKKNS